jgi:hypothetical protein
MKCPACGQDFGVAHNCPGVLPGLTTEEASPPPQGFAPLYYLQLAFSIVRWDDISIRRAARDPKAAYYGAALWAISATVILLFAIIPVASQQNLSGPAATIGVAFAVGIGLLIMAMLTVFQLGFCHLIAKWLLKASGTFAGIMRPLLLGWMVNLLILVPVVGPLASGIAWLAVLMLVFEEVDGIGRLQAFVISAVVSVISLAIQSAVLR